MTDNHKAKSGQKTRNGQNTIYRDEATVAKKKEKKKRNSWARGRTRGNKLGRTQERIPETLLTRTPRI